jgi:nitric oxide reductase activation protein
MEHDPFSHDGLLARLADAEKLVRSLIYVEVKCEISASSVDSEDLSKVGEALSDAQKMLQQLRPGSTHELDFCDEKLGKRSTERTLAKEVLLPGLEWAFAALESIQDACDSYRCSEQGALHESVRRGFDRAASCRRRRERSRIDLSRRERG